MNARLLTALQEYDEAEAMLDAAFGRVEVGPRRMHNYLALKFENMNLYRVSRQRLASLPRTDPATDLPVP